MTSYEEVFFADVYSEQFQNSYADYYPGAYQTMVPVIYEYPDVYYYCPIFDDFQPSPMTNYYVHLTYYIPVYDVPVAYSFDDVQSQRYTAPSDLSYSSTFGYPISETSDGSLGNYAAASEECSTFEIFYKEEEEHLNEASFNDDDDDDKRQNNDDKKLTTDSEESYYSSSDESIHDKREGALTKFGNCWDLSLIDGGYRSDSSENSDDEVLDVHSAVQYCRKSASYNSRVRLKKAIDENDEEYYSSQESDFDEEEDTKIQRFKNVLDFSMVDDDDQRSQDNFHSSKIETRNENISDSFNSEISKSKSECLKEKIVASKEYAEIQENLEYSDHYKKWLYKLALKKNPRRNDDILLDYLPPVIEEEEEEEVEDVENVCSQSSEIVSIDNDDDSKTENKQQKKRFKSVRNFLSRLFCCSAKNEPP